jgi:hypothetical protein
MASATGPETYPLDTFRGSAGACAGLERFGRPETSIRRLKTGGKRSLYLIVEKILVGDEQLSEKTRWRYPR